MSATVPTNAEFLALKAQVATVQATLANLQTIGSAESTEVSLLAARVTALEDAAVLPVLPPVVLPPLGHAPGGLSLLTDQPWDGIFTLGWDYLRRAASKDSVIISDLTGPKSPPSALRLIFTPDMGSDNEPGVHWFPLGLRREVFWSYVLRISAGWHASPAGACKMTYCMAPSSNLWTALNHPPSGVGPPFQAVARTEWLGRYYLPQTPTPINPGDWMFYEWYVKLASPGATDGVLRWWVNGNLNGDYTDVPGTPASGFGEFQIAPTVQQAPPTEQYMDVDHISVSAP